MTHEDEIKALVEKSKRYLKSADLLIGDGDYDSAVSRAYYAMFYLAQALLLREGLSFSSHKSVIGAFGKHLIKSGKLKEEFHRSFIDLFEMRQMGDYEARTATDKQMATKALTRAKTFIEEISHMLERK